MASDLVVIDAGPIVAMLNDREEHHSWVVGITRELEGPYFTSESVLSEAFFLLQDSDQGMHSLFSLLERGSIQLLSVASGQVEGVVKLMRRYRNLPMSLADATLVHFSELQPNIRVFTLDRHFRIYRRNGRQLIPLIIPDDVR